MQIKMNSLGLCHGKYNKQGSIEKQLLLALPFTSRFPNAILYLPISLQSRGIRCADERYPGVYSRISQFTDWIVQTSCIVSQNPPEYFDCSHRPQVEDTTNLYVEFSITPTIAPKFAPTMHPTTANNNMPVSSPSSPHDGSLPPSAPTVASSSSPPLSNGFGGPTFATISLLLTMIAMTFGGPTRT